MNIKINLERILSKSFENLKKISTQKSQDSN